MIDRYVYGERERERERENEEENDNTYPKIYSKVKKIIIQGIFGSVNFITPRICAKIYRSEIL